MPHSTPRILLKLSGESLAGECGHGIDGDLLSYYTDEIVDIYNNGIQVSIVIGAGNIFRGVSGINTGISRITGDYMGMMATVINSLALKATLKNKSIPVKIITSFKIEKVGEMYNQDKIDRFLEDNTVLIFAGGTSHPFFTTDTTASLRASEINADYLLKATRVDGVYDKDPEKETDATKYEKIKFIDVLTQRLKIMDSTAVSMCMDNDIKIIVFNILKKGNLLKNCTGNITGTIISN